MSHIQRSGFTEVLWKVSPASAGEGAGPEIVEWYYLPEISALHQKINEEDPDKKMLRPLDIDILFPMQGAQPTPRGTIWKCDAIIFSGSLRATEKKIIYWGWRGDSAAKNTYCSYRGSRFSSQHPCQEAHSHVSANSSSRENTKPQASLDICNHPLTHSCACPTHKQTHIKQK